MVLVPYSIDLYRVTLALNYLGATAIFIEDWIAFKQLDACCRAAKPDALVTHSTGLFYGLFKKALRKIPKRIHHAKFQSYGPLSDISKPDERTIAIISFTSGTSGIPKKVERSYAFLAHQFMTLKAVKSSQADEVELQTMPAFLFIGLAVGSTSIIAAINKLKPHKTDYAQVEQQILDNGVNAICASPSFLLKLATQLTRQTNCSPNLKNHDGRRTRFPRGCGSIKSGIYKCKNFDHLRFFRS